MMTPEAKRWLSRTVRDLRERLLGDLRGEVDGRYKLQVPLQQAQLSQENRRKRLRLESWLDEQVRGGGRGLKEKDEAARERFLMNAVKLAGATLLNRLVVVRQMEILGLARVKLVSGGWDSSDYADFRSFFGSFVRDEEAEGFPLLLSLVFDELALDLPGLFGEVGITGLIPLPTATLRHTLDTLKARELGEEERLGLWRDDTLLGWVYQFWNDPEREALDLKVKNKGKIENHELAAKTQLFTDRYMVEWILQNSLGEIWFAICERNSWTPQVVGEGTLDGLEARRQEWRWKRESGDVSREALMPLQNSIEDRWKYWVPRQPLSAHDSSLLSLRDMRLLDPACGSGHFLIIAFDLLVALYEEEAKHRGEVWSSEQIAVWILDNNLHGIDVDTRAVQIAAAALWLKMRSYSLTANPQRLSLVSSDFGLGRMSLEDPEVRAFVRSVEEETGIPAKFVEDLVQTLKDADHLGSLLRIDQDIDRALSAVQGGLFDRGDARDVLTERLEMFVQEHSYDEDLRLRLRGESLARSTEFLRLNRAETYDLVVLNPPYQNRGKLAASSSFTAMYPDANADLFAAFMLRALEFSKLGGLAAWVTLSNWQFLGSFQEIRQLLCAKHSLVLLADLGKAAFSSGSMLINSSMGVFQNKGPDIDSRSYAIRAYSPEEVVADPQQVSRNMAALSSSYSIFEFQPKNLRAVPESPLVYWWSEEFLNEYCQYAKLSDSAPARKGICTSSDERFYRLWYEPNWHRIACLPFTSSGPKPDLNTPWQPGLKGAKDRIWFEPLIHVLNWNANGMEIKLFIEHLCGCGFTKRVQNESYYFRPGVAFSMIGSYFSARAHRYQSVFGNAGSSVFPVDIPNTVCLMNSAKAKYVLTSLNPSVNFGVGDVNRLPLFPIESANEIVAQLDTAFTQHEQAREASVEFLKPGPSAWTYAQQWAQTAVDREAGTPLPIYDPVFDQPTASDALSYALGLALGRFPCETEALPQGILFLAERGDSLDHPATELLQNTWNENPLSKLELREYLKTKFFSEDHLDRYEKRPIYFPLSSEKKSFVAYISIHRWQPNTLDILLADHLQPEVTRLNGELNDLAEARNQGDRKQQANAQARYQQITALIAELQNFIDTLRTVAERGAPPTDAKCKPRQVDAPYAMDLDDGVMINSAALWPLLLPQWKAPKEWWKELSNGEYDWAHLSMRYFPARVTARCQEDPSLAVAHGLFWKYHPAKAAEWELRLRDPEELGTDFRLDEPGSDEPRAVFRAGFPDVVRELRFAEEKRRAKRSDKATLRNQGTLDFEED